jgi:hypothetical protein
MRQLTVADDVYEQVTLLARAWATSPGDVLRRLLIEFRGPEDRPVEPTAGRIAVHAIYAGARTEGSYDPITQSLTITTGPLADQAFGTPSGAAVALVAASSPEVNPNRNGWSFWVQSANGERLQAIRSRRSRPRLAGS